MGTHQLEQETEAHKKLVTIVVNGTRHEWPKGKITYAQVVTLDVPDWQGYTRVNKPAGRTI